MDSDRNQLQGVYRRLVCFYKNQSKDMFEWGN